MKKMSGFLRHISYLFVVVTALAFMMVIAKPLHAATQTSNVNISSEKVKLSNSLYGGETWTIKVTNDTSYSATFPLKIWYSMQNGNGGYAKESLKITVDGTVYNPGVSATVYSNSALNYTISIPSGQTKYISVNYSNSDNNNAKSTQYLQMYFSAEATIDADYIDNGDSNNYIQLNFDTSYKVAKTAAGYYYFHLDQPADVTIKTKSVNAYSYLINENGSTASGDSSGSITSSSEVERDFRLGAGNHYLITFNSDSMLNVSISKKDLEWGTMDISVSGNHVSAVYTDAASADSYAKDHTYITSWSCDSNSCESTLLSGTPKSFEGDFQYSISTPGWYTVKVTVRNDAYGNNTYTSYSKDFLVKPAVPSTPTLSKVTETSVTTNGLGSSTTNGNYISVQIYKDGKWCSSTVSAGDSATISGLKPNTVYKLRIAGIVRKSGKSDAISDPSLSTSFRTGAKVKPAVKSVKISGAKVKYIAKKWHSGYWNATYTHYYPGYYTGGYYLTTYKITVTLKKRYAGPAGILINGVYKATKSKKITVSSSSTGKMKGKKVKVNICYANNSKWGGRSLYTTKKVKIK